jgi:hypothetical protein
MVDFADRFAGVFVRGDELDFSIRMQQKNAEQF